VNAALIDTVCEEQPIEAGRNDQDRLGKVLPPALYGVPSVFKTAERRLLTARVWRRLVWIVRTSGRW
jgi:hypothetical protein